MFGNKIFRSLSILSILFLAACAKNGGSGRGQYAPQLSSDDGGSAVVVQSGNGVNAGAIVQCGVSLSQDTVAPNQVISITVTASGGYAPYRLNTTTAYGNFGSTQTITGYFTNTTTSNRIVEKTFSVIDNAGNAGSCYFKVTVLPSGANPVDPNSNKCSLAANPSSPGVNSAFNLTLTPNLTGSYILRSLQLQSDWSIMPNTTATGAIAYQVTYITTGARTISAVIEQNGQQYSCNLSLTVGTTPSNPTSGAQVNIAVSPAVTQVVGTTFVLTPTLTGFAASPAPTIQVNSNDSTIQVAANGNAYNITGNGTVRTFTVTVTASQGTGAAAVVASKAVTLSYINGGGGVTPTPTPGAMACSIAIPSGILSVGQELVLPMQIVGNSSDVVIFNAVDPGLNGFVLSGTVAPVRVKYTTPGTRVITVYGARSAITNTACNNGVPMTISITVQQTLVACDAQIAPNVSLSGQVVKAQAMIPANSGNGPFETTMSSTSPYFEVKRVDGPMQAMVRFRRPGSYPVVMTVKDLSNGSQVSCSTIHQVVAADTFAVAEDEVGSLVRVFKGGYAQEILRNGGFKPFGDVLPYFTGGNRVALADINADGVVDLITAAGYNGGLRVRAWDGTNLAMIRDFVALQGLNSGTNRTYLAAGDINADGYADIVLGAGCNSNKPWVEIWNGKTGAIASRFQSGTYNSGVRVAVGDVNGDGYSDVVTSSCSASQVNGFSGKDITFGGPTVNPQAFNPFISFFTYPGVNTEHKVAVADVNGDGFADIITATNGANAQFHKIFSGKPSDGLALMYSLKPFNGKNGIYYVGAGDVNGDGLADIISGGDLAASLSLKVFNSNGYGEILGPSSAGGAFYPFAGRCPQRMYVAGGVGGL